MIHFNIVLTCLLVTLLVYVLTHLWRYRRYYYLGLKIPNPSLASRLSGFVIISYIGSSLDKLMAHLSKKFEENCSRENMVFKFWVGPLLCVVPTNPDVVHEVLVNVLHKASCYKLMSGSSGQGLIQHTHLPRWAKHRKIIGTSFQHSVLKSNIRVFFEEATVLANKMAPLAMSKEPFEPHHLVGLASMSTLVRNSFGVDLKIQQNNISRHPYLESVESSFKIFLHRVFKTWLLINFLDTIFGFKQQLRKNRIIQKKFITTVIETVKKNIVDNNGNTPDLSKAEGHPPHDTFVARILRDNLQHCPAQHSMTEKELLHEMVTLLNAGFDTLMITISLVLNVLALHPQLQQDVLDEIQNTLEDDTIPTYDQLQNLSLLTRVIKEVMRLYPAAPIIARSSPTDLKFGDHIIPAEATICIFIYGIHRDPRHWPDPSRFDPDRFLPSEVAKRNPNAYLPFSLGARNCIGSKYAMLQMKTIISTLLRRYKILKGHKCTSMQDIGFQFGMTLHLLDGNDIVLEGRH